MPSARRTLSHFPLLLVPTAVGVAAVALLLLPGAAAAPETEPNNAWYEASPADFGDSATGTVQSTDSDYFQLNITEPCWSR